MKENVPNLAKEIDFQEVQKTRESQRSWTQRGTHQGTYIIIKLPKIKDERILKAARGKETATYKGVPIRLSADFSKETLQARSIQSHEKQGPTSKITTSSKAII